MNPDTETRLDELRTEFQAGQKMLAEIEAKRSHLKSTLLRISGAIQVLEELLEKRPSQSEEAGAVEPSRNALAAT